MGVKTEKGDIVDTWPSSLSLKCYSKREIHGISIKEITSVSIGNQEGEDCEDGLYDPAMGPNNRRERCITCGLNSMYCPGHCGHIDLGTETSNHRRWL